ncbi:MAG: hypothetical protein IKT38_01855 [Clostridia bacterium]|nr:hypothetical protein [Clostridia bacterium]
MKLIFKRGISFLCIATIMLTMTSILSISASAATAKQKFDCDKTVTFTVKTNTKGTPSIKFVSDAAPKTLGHRCNKAPLMAISVSPAINGKNFFLISGTGKNIASTLKLQKNKTYTIKVSYYVNKTNKCSCLDMAYVNIHNLGGSTTYRGFNGRDIYTNGFWYISKASNCSVSNIRVK